MKKNEESLCKSWDPIEKNYICVKEVPEGERREKGTVNLVTKIMAENNPNLERDMAIHESTQRSLHQDTL